MKDMIKFRYKYLIKRNHRTFKRTFFYELGDDVPIGNYATVENMLSTFGICFLDWG